MRTNAPKGRSSCFSLSTFPAGFGLEPCCQGAGLPLAQVGWLPFPQPRRSHGEVRAEAWRVLRLVVPSYTGEMRHPRTFASLRLNRVSEIRLGREDGCRRRVGSADGARSPLSGISGLAEMLPGGGMLGKGPSRLVCVFLAGIDVPP